jgi:hypothetical protein
MERQTRMRLDEPARYEIKVHGELSDRWNVWFPEMEVIVERYNGSAVTCLVGVVLDQADLYGLISRIRDMGLSLISVNRL